MKKTAMDPRDGLIQSLRVGSSPFGEGRVLSEHDEADEETTKRILESRLLQHERLLTQLDAATELLELQKKKTDKEQVKEDSKSE